MLFFPFGADECAGITVEAICPKGKKRLAPRIAWGKHHMWDFGFRMSNCGFGMLGAQGVAMGLWCFALSGRDECAGITVEAICPKGKKRLAPRIAWGRLSRHHYHTLCCL